MTLLRKETVLSKNKTLDIVLDDVLSVQDRSKIPNIPLPCLRYHLYLGHGRGLLQMGGCQLASRSYKVEI